MTILGLRRRVASLEFRRQADLGLFFLAWGRNDYEIDRALADAKAMGRITRGDQVVRGTWSLQVPLPPCRWVKDRIDALSRDEFDVLGDSMEARARSRGWSPPLEPNYEHSELDQLTDAALVCAALGEALAES